MASGETASYIGSPNLSPVAETCLFDIIPRHLPILYACCVCSSSACTENSVFQNPEDICPQEFPIDMLDVKKRGHRGGHYFFRDWFKNFSQGCILSFYYDAAETIDDPFARDFLMQFYIHNNITNISSEFELAISPKVEPNMSSYTKEPTRSFSHLIQIRYHNWRDVKRLLYYAVIHYRSIQTSNCPTKKVFIPSFYLIGENATETGPCFVYIPVFPRIPNVDRVYPYVGINVAPIHFDPKIFTLELRNELENYNCSYELYKLASEAQQEIGRAIHAVLACIIEPEIGDFINYQPLVEKVRKEVMKCPKSINETHYYMENVTDDQICGQYVRPAEDQHYKILLNPLTQDEFQLFSNSLMETNRKSPFFQSQCIVLSKKNETICTCLPMFDCTDVRTASKLYLITIGKPKLFIN
uniref:Uncharacterized protein n=1 Tax=Panagrolaimus sp. JU765 TaxID=591449 RepID=A0AC34PVN5_9BILA